MIMEMFSYDFIIRAVVVGTLVSLCAALLGVSLVLKRYSMICDGLSHVGFGTLAIAAALNLPPLEITVPVVVIAAIFLLKLSETGKIKGDSAIALISTGALAVGVTVTSAAKGMNTDINNYMFGSILAMDSGDVCLSIILSVVVIAVFVILYNRIFAVTFDETFAKTTGIKTGVYNMITAVLTAITTVLGMRMMGALLISGLVIFPALTSMRVCKRFKSVVICSAVISIACFFAGMIASYILSLPTGASVVIVNAIVFAGFSVIGRLRSGK